jgi:H+/Cl- antiporter ClcA
LYVLAAIGALMGVMTWFAIRENVRRNAATGDFAGASLGMAFLLMGLLPLTLAAVLLALWLAPPGWGRRRRGDLESSRKADAATSPRPRNFRVMLVPGLVVAGAALVGVTGVLLANALRGASQNHGLGGPGLVLVAIQDLFLFSPILLLAGVLFWIAGSMMLRDRRPE